MLKNYLVILVRNLIRTPSYSIINTLGLAVGLASFILILLYVQNELNYDRHHDEPENLYRISLKGEMGGNVFHTATTGGPVGAIVQEEIPEIISHTTVYKANRTTLMDVGENKFYIDRVGYADSTFFGIFHYDFLRGNPKTALVHPNSVVLSESLASKLFSGEDPLGKSIKFNGREKMLVRGVFKENGNNSHLNFDAISSMSTFRSNERMWNHMNSLYTFITYNYIRINGKIGPVQLAEKLNSVIYHHMGDAIEEYDMKLELVPNAVQSIHLHSHLIHEMEENGESSRIAIFSAIALLILVIACINFINLSTARSARRAREVGIRKVFGATRPALIRQFTGESVLISLISLGVALMMVELFLPAFENLSGVAFGTLHTGNWRIFILLILLAVFVGVVSGIYPAFFISSYQPVKVLKGKLFEGTHRPLLRNLTVIIQFVISVFIILSTITIYRQLYYMDQKDLGMNQKDLVVVTLRDRELIEKYKMIRDELELLPGVKGVSGSSSIPGNFEERKAYYPEGTTRQGSQLLTYINADYNYLELMDAKIADGRSFNQNIQLDSAAIIINQALVKKMGWDDPLGRHIFLPQDNPGGADIKYTVVGVVKDFHFASLHKEVDPLIISTDPQYFRNLSIRIDPKSTASTLGFLEKKWNEFSPDRPFEYRFLETSFKNLYRAEYKMSNLFIYFSILAVFIASLGLFGLALYTTERRTQEIGVRRVFGGTVTQISRLLLGEFTRWVALANLLAWPLAWYFLHRWLQNFAFQTSIAWWIFVLTGMISLMVALITVSWHSIRTALKNPVESLRYE